MYVCAGTSSALMTVIVCFPLHVSRHVNKETDRSLLSSYQRLGRELTACLSLERATSDQRPSCQEVLRLALYFLIEKALYDISHSFLPAPR